MTSDDDTITNRMLLEHMQSMQSGLERKIEDVKSELKKDLSSLENKLGKKIEGLTKKVDLINTGIENIDERVDHVETKRL